MSSSPEKSSEAPSETGSYAKALPRNTATAFDKKIQKKAVMFSHPVAQPLDQSAIPPTRPTGLPMNYAQAATKNETGPALVIRKEQNPEIQKLGETGRAKDDGDDGDDGDEDIPADLPWTVVSRASKKKKKGKKKTVVPKTPNSSATLPDAVTAKPHMPHQAAQLRAITGSVRHGNEPHLQNRGGAAGAPESVPEIPYLVKMRWKDKKKKSGRKIENSETNPNYPQISSTTLRDNVHITDNAGNFTTPDISTNINTHLARDNDDNTMKNNKEKIDEQTIAKHTTAQETFVQDNIAQESTNLETIEETTTQEDIIPETVTREDPESISGPAVNGATDAMNAMTLTDTSANTAVDYDLEVTSEHPTSPALTTPRTESELDFILNHGPVISSTGEVKQASSNTENSMTKTEDATPAPISMGANQYENEEEIEDNDGDGDCGDGEAEDKIEDIEVRSEENEEDQEQDRNEQNRAAMRRVLDQGNATLWEHPFGADVIIECRGNTWRVHRDILLNESAWFMRHIPAPSPGGEPVVWNLDLHSPGQLATVLKFVYEKSYTGADMDPEDPINGDSILKNAAMYVAGMSVACSAMEAYAVRHINEAAVFLRGCIHDLHRREDLGRLAEPLHKALQVVYEQDRGLTFPLRLALARLVDVTIMYMIMNPEFRGVYDREWGPVSSLIALDNRFFSEAGLLLED